MRIAIHFAGVVGCDAKGCRRNAPGHTGNCGLSKAVVTRQTAIGRTSDADSQIASGGDGIGAHYMGAVVGQRDLRCVGGKHVTRNASAHSGVQYRACCRIGAVVGLGQGATNTRRRGQWPRVYGIRYYTCARYKCVACGAVQSPGIAHTTATSVRQASGCAERSGTKANKRKVFVICSARVANDRAERGGGCASVRAACRTSSQGGVNIQLSRRCGVNKAIARFSWRGVVSIRSTVVAEIGCESAFYHAGRIGSIRKPTAIEG